MKILVYYITISVNVGVDGGECLVKQQLTHGHQFLLVIKKGCFQWLCNVNRNPIKTL